MKTVEAVGIFPSLSL